VDDVTWTRGRGRALAQSLALLLHYRGAYPALAADVRQVIQAILADHRNGA
jgi:aminoglycoside phosphotransferase (APT) family kinase protein